MMKFYKHLSTINTHINKKKWDNSPQAIIEEILDPLFQISQEIIGENIIILNQARILKREKKLSEGKEKYALFQLNWKRFASEVNHLSTSINKNISDHKLIKTLDALEILVKNSTRKPDLTKIPSPPIAFLELPDTSEAGIDWIINKISDYLGKFASIYSSTRIYYLLKI